MPTEGRKEPTTWAEATKMLRQNAAEGKMSDTDIFGDDPLSPKKDAYGYLGHFANDDVAAQGHNVGAKQIGTKEAGNGTVAKQGFKRIPGNANDGYVAKKARLAMDLATSNINRFGGPIRSYGMGPVVGEPDQAPLRKRDRIAKAAAKRPSGPLRSKSK